MAENENIAYEKLVQEIYQALNNQEDVKNINVQHNVNVAGKSGCKHQIDVFWEFEIAGITHKVAIECKNWTSDVPIGKIRDFFGVLHDIGNIKGVFVTKVGYQSGAKKYADYYGIDLKEARIPTDGDWSARVKDIILHFTALQINVKSRKPILDQDWIKQNVQFKENETIQLKGDNKELYIYDSEGNKITNFYDLEQKLPHSWEACKDQTYSYTFEDGYLKIGERKLKLISIDFLYDVETTTEEMITEGESIVKAILKDVKSGELKSLKHDGHMQ